MAVSSLSQYFQQGAIEGFLDAVAPLSAFSYAVQQNGAALNDIVRVPFINAGTASVAFTYAGGYSTNNQVDVTGKAITLDTILTQPFNITDADSVVLSNDTKQRMGYALANKLGISVVSASIAAVVTNANFALASRSGSNDLIAERFSASAASFAEIDKLANDACWPSANRSIIASTGLWNYMLQNSIVNTAYSYGGSEVVRTGQLPQVFGFQPYKTTVNLPLSAKGLIVNPDAVLVGMAYHKPQIEAANIVYAQEIRDEKTGVVIGVRSWYDADYARVRTVLDCLCGFAMGNPNSLFYIAS